jgi:hypothetical protein
VDSTVTAVNRLTDTQLANTEWQSATDVHGQAKPKLLLKTDRKTLPRRLAETVTSAK